jgi:cytochrome c oxidase assembly factor CtaG
MIVISLYFDILKFKSTKINLKLFINIFLNQINFYLYYFYFLYSKIVKKNIFTHLLYIFTFL